MDFSFCGDQPANWCWRVYKVYPLIFIGHATEVFVRQMAVCAESAFSKFANHPSSPSPFIHDKGGGGNLSWPTNHGERYGLITELSVLRILRALTLHILSKFWQRWELILRLSNPDFDSLISMLVKFNGSFLIHSKIPSQATKAKYLNLCSS